MRTQRVMVLALGLVALLAQVAADCPGKDDCESCLSSFGVHRKESLEEVAPHGCVWGIAGLGSGTCARAHESGGAKEGWLKAPEEDAVQACQAGKVLGPLLGLDEPEDGALEDSLSELDSDSLSPRGKHDGGDRAEIHRVAGYRYADTPDKNDYRRAFNVIRKIYGSDFALADPLEDAMVDSGLPPAAWINPKVSVRKVEFSRSYVSYLARRGRVVENARGSGKFLQGPLWKGQPELSDVRQGNYGICWFLAAILSLLRSPDYGPHWFMNKMELIEGRAMGLLHTHRVRVLMYNRGEPVVLDFRYTEQTYGALERYSANWVIVLIKALAAYIPRFELPPDEVGKDFILADHSTSNSGLIIEAFRLLVGPVPMHRIDWDVLYDAGSHDGKFKKLREQVHAMVKVIAQTHSPAGACTRGTAGDTTTWSLVEDKFVKDARKLLAHHVYSIEGLEEVSDRLHIALRDPHGDKRGVSAVIYVALGDFIQHFQQFGFLESPALRAHLGSSIGTVQLELNAAGMEMHRQARAAEMEQRGSDEEESPESHYVDYDDEKHGGPDDESHYVDYDDYKHGGPDDESHYVDSDDYKHGGP